MNKSAASVARYLLGRQDTKNIAFWKEHLRLIQSLGTLAAVLSERLFYFKRDPGRINGIQLLVMTDLTWQVIRSLCGISGSDRAWLDDYLPIGHEDMFPPDHPHSFTRDAEIVDDLIWVFEQHTSLRHPKREWAWMFNDPWPSADSLRLMRAAEAVDGILTSFEVTLDPESGFEGEVLEKQRLVRAVQKPEE